MMFDRAAVTRWPLALVMAAAAAAPVAAGQSQYQAPMPIPPERLSWYGDPKAPNISGVWVRADAPTAAGQSKEGWMPWPPPLKGKFADIWRQRVADAAAGKRTDDPVRNCLPPGMPRYMTGTTSELLIIQTPGRVMMYRDSAPVRRIWLDGRPFPDAKNLESFSNGNARGHYEKGDLLTEVVGIKDEPIDSTGVPHSDDLKISERLHRVDATTLSVTVTLTDPTAYTRPMVSTVIYRASTNPLWEPKEFICTPKTDYHPDTYVH